MDPPGSECVCVCVCVSDRERERQGERERNKTGKLSSADVVRVGAHFQMVHVRFKMF